ncbi:MAG: GDSL-type esterase/lipase family protein [Planctomycetia bacterium]|nr:GDSL-type esterase/lipase family protein [Planctomycetia bacterium]
MNRKLPVPMAVPIIMLLCWLAVPAALMPRGACPSAEENVPGPVRLCLPPVIHAVVGVEMNVYFDNVVLAIRPEAYAFDVNCPLGIQQNERWTLTPSADQVGSQPFELTVRDDRNQVLARGRSIINVVPADAGVDRPVTMLVIGDSLTHASVYTQRVLDLCKTPGNPKLTLVGSFHPADPTGANRHEGYGGWTAERFATFYRDTARQGDVGQRGSPFLYQEPGGQPKLDFARYCKEFNGGSGPDFVAILLGCNDTFSDTDETIEGRIDGVLRHYDTLIGMIHGVRPDTRIGLMLTVPPAATQDPFGDDYRCGQTRWQYKRNQHRLVERLLAKYAGREAEHVYAVPTEVNLDCLHNYPTRTAKCNAQSEEETVRLANGVHPAASGYRQIGDTLYAWLKAGLGSR